MFAFILLFTCISLVCANSFSKTATLEKGDEVKGTAVLGVDYRTYITPTHLSTTKPAITTKVQRKLVAVWVTMSSKTQTINYLQRYNSNWQVNTRDNTRIVWKNGTNYSSITGSFGAEDI